MHAFQQLKKGVFGKGSFRNLCAELCFVFSLCSEVIFSWKSHRNFFQKLPLQRRHFLENPLLVEGTLFVGVVCGWWSPKKRLDSAMLSWLGRKGKLHLNVEGSRICTWFKGVNWVHTKGVMQQHATLRRVLRRFFRGSTSFQEGFLEGVV